MNDTHELRDLKYRLKLANKMMGRQGQTIANLRGELARTREENSKIDRGELRILRRFMEVANHKMALDEERLKNASDEIKRLREKLDAAQTVPWET